MDEIITTAKNCEIGEADFYYWQYQYLLGKEFIVPYFQKNICSIDNKNIAEIGSAEGGVLHSFVKSGAAFGLGTDIATNRLETGRTISKATKLYVEFVNHNIISDEIPQNWLNFFDIVILRDVIEHIENTKLALENIFKIIKPSGFLFVTFPPYRSPFGGHQHTLAGNFLTKLPYIHLLPNFIFKKFISSGRPIDIDEVLRLRNIKLSSTYFKKIINILGFKIYKEEYYFLRPVFKMKFGLPTLRITPFGKIPFIGDLISLEAMYIIKK